MPRSPVARLLYALAAILFAATVAAVIALWPDGSRETQLGESLRPPVYDARVAKLSPAPCQNPEAKGCQRVEVQLLEGPDAGERATIRTGESLSDPDFAISDRVRMAKNEVPPDAGPGIPAYSFADFDRRAPMQWLLAVFALVVVVFGRIRGILSLIGLGASIAIVASFIVPAILDGRAPLAVAVAGSFAVMFATLLLGHGIGAKSIAAILGTGGSLLLTAGLATLFTNLAHITGFSSEEATLLGASGGELSLEGLVLAGMVIAALGVLDDLTVSQASSVLALRAANERLGFVALYRRAVAIGRDHVAATVNTLVLAYVGAALPVLLIFSVGGTPFVDAINREVVSEQIVGTLVGSIGLIVAVPLTTALAALLAARLPAESLGARRGHTH